MIAIRTDEAIPLLQASGWRVSSGEDGIYLGHERMSRYVPFLHGQPHLVNAYDVQQMLNLIRVRKQQ